MISFTIGTLILAGLYAKDPWLFGIALGILALTGAVGAEHLLHHGADWMNQWWLWVWLTQPFHGLTPFWTWYSGEESFLGWTYLTAFLVWGMDLGHRAYLWAAPFWRVGAAAVPGVP